MCIGARAADEEHLRTDVDARVHRLRFEHEPDDGLGRGELEILHVGAKSHVAERDAVRADAAVK